LDGTHLEERKGEYIFTEIAEKAAGSDGNERNRKGKNIRKISDQWKTKL